MNNQKELDFKVRNIITHNRKFHLDEVFAIAMLYYFYVDSKHKTRFNIIRTRDSDVIKEHQLNTESFVIDVGFEHNPDMLNFDHHQQGFSKCWEDGTPMSSCGLVWNYLKTNKHLNQKMNDDMIKLFEEKLIKPIDKHDNGIQTFTKFIYVLEFNRNASDERVMFGQFLKALEASKGAIENFWFAEKENIRTSKDFSKHIKSVDLSKNFIIFDNNNHYFEKEVNNNSDYSHIKFISLPHSKDKFIIKGVNGNFLPESMKKTDSQFIDGVVFEFCHESLFMCIVKIEDGNKDKLKRTLEILSLI